MASRQPCQRLRRPASKALARAATMNQRKGNCYGCRCTTSRLCTSSVAVVHAREVGPPREAAQRAAAIRRAAHLPRHADVR